jgi:hypothetical protein
MDAWKAVLQTNDSLSKFSSSETGVEATVRWSTFDRRDPKMGVFLQSTEATRCGHILK